MNVIRVLFNEHGRLRSGWRFGIFVFSFIICGLVIGLISQTIFGSLFTGSVTFMLVNSIFSLLVAVGLGWFCGKFLEDVPLKALGITFSRGWLRHLLVGVILGTATLLLAVGIAGLLAGYSFQLDSLNDSASIQRTLIISLLVFAVAAAFEEVLFRGYILQTFARSGLSWLAIALTALFFGLVHSGNPGANAVSTLNTGLAGIWFGIAYLKSRDLWFPFGMHLMWNWTQGSIFGIEVSGLTQISQAPVLNEIDHGPGWITGGDYGIEAGIPTTIAIILSIVAIYFFPFLNADSELIELTSKEKTIRSTGS